MAKSLFGIVTAAAVVGDTFVYVSWSGADAWSDKFVGSFETTKPTFSLLLLYAAMNSSSPWFSDFQADYGLWDMDGVFINLYEIFNASIRKLPGIEISLAACLHTSVRLQAVIMSSTREYALLFEPAAAVVFSGLAAASRVAEVCRNGMAKGTKIN